MATNEKGSVKRTYTTPSTTKPTMKTPITTVNPTPKKKNPYKIFLPITIALGVLLLGAIGYLTYESSANQRALEMKISQLEEADELRVELEEQYNIALADLEDLRGSNEELNELIDEQRAELEEQKNKIARLIRQKKNLTNARVEVDEFKLQIEELVAQVENLKAENEALAAKNDELENNNSLLKDDLQVKIVENSQLNEARAVLVSEKEVLNKKVNLASVINVKNVQVEGFKMRGDKPIKRKSAKTIEQLKVCFTTVVNEVTEPGKEKFYIRIVNPIGETMAVDELGSGKIMNKKTGEEVPFTQMKEYDYGNDEAELCFVWEPNVTFQRGNYHVEVYNKGHKAGNGTFSLK